MQLRNIPLAIAASLLSLSALAVLGIRAPRPAAPSTDVAYEQSVYLPSRNGFSVYNRKAGEDVLVSSLRRFGLTGQCGGLTFASIDHFAAGSLPPVAERPHELTETALVRYLSLRSAASLAGNGARFLLWTLKPDVSTRWKGRGVGDLTRQEEVPRLEAALREGPVPLGLVRARSLPAVGSNHQAVAFAVEWPEPGLALVRLYDPNQPMADNVYLRVEMRKPQRPVVLYRGMRRVKEYRGFFVERYRDVAPPPGLSRALDEG